MVTRFVNLSLRISPSLLLQMPTKNMQIILRKDHCITMVIRNASLLRDFLNKLGAFF